MEPTQVSNSENKSIGPALGIIIIVLSLVIGSLYVWTQKLKQYRIPAQPISTTTYTVAPPITVTATTSASAH